MNIVYLIGNGFDKNLGMKTDYRDFYRYYLDLPIDTDTAVIKSFKQELRKERYKNFDKWSDLELALGGYLKFLDADQAVELHEHLVENLSRYIKLEEDKWPFDTDSKSLFCKYLMSPHKENRLLEMDASAIDTHRSRWNNYTWVIKIITFNYSMSIERILKKQLGKIGNHHGSTEINLSAMEHIHGFTDERMILGVNDSSQIANEKLRGEASVTNRYVKSDCNNNAYRKTHDRKCHQWIGKSNLICTFGLSFGDTDKKWWEAVGDTLKGDCKMILFEHNKKEFTPNQGATQLEEENRVKDRFLAQTTLDDNLKEKIKKNIYVAYNTNMFKLDIGKSRFTEEQLRQLGFNDRQVKAVLYVKERGRITNKEYQEINNVSGRTATYELKGLVGEFNFLRMSGAGAGIYYELH